MAVVPTAVANVAGNVLSGWLATTVVKTAGKPAQFASTSAPATPWVTVSLICAPTDGAESTGELSYIARVPAEVPMLFTVKHVVPVAPGLRFAPPKVAVVVAA